MLEQLGKALAEEFEDVEFIGLFHGEDRSVCTFNCNRTGATFCGNTLEVLEKRISFIRENHSPLAQERA